MHAIFMALYWAVQSAGLPRHGLTSTFLGMADWHKLALRLERQGVDFVLKPSLRFVGQPGEQGTMFFKDPSGNPMEIKGYENAYAVFSH